MRQKRKKRFLTMLLSLSLLVTTCFSGLGAGVFGEEKQAKAAGYGLSNPRWNGDDAFLLADRCLDSITYNVVYADITWETSTLRSWLNGYDYSKNSARKDYSDVNFMKNAFNVEEYNAIQVNMVKNDKNPYFQNLENSNDTLDKVYLLSISEAKKELIGNECEVVLPIFSASGIKENDFIWGCSQLYVVE